MDKYPLTKLNDITDINNFANALREFRERDIVAWDNLVQLAGYEAGFRRATVTTAADLPIGINDLAVDVNATAADRTITLLASPLDGQTHIITKNDGSANNVIVDGNGKNINGAATISWNTRYQGRLLIYMGGSGEWRAMTL